MKLHEPVFKVGEAIALVSRVTKRLFILAIPIKEKEMPDKSSFMCYAYRISDRRWGVGALSPGFYSTLKSIKLEHKKRALIEMFSPGGPFVMLQR